MSEIAAGGALLQFQDAFADALLGREAPRDSAIADLAGQPAFAVYRNTVMKGCIDALRANFPAVARLVGEEWFRAAAAVFVAGDLPVQPSLLAYGDGFPAFLEGFEPAAQLPYLPDVARLERLWTQAHTAADEPALGLVAMGKLDPEELAAAVLHPHAAARWAWFPETPIFTIWSRNREESANESEIDWHGEGALLTRPDGAVRWIAIDAAGVRFLEACALGHPVGQALGAALDADAGANLVQSISDLLDAGAFTRLSAPGIK